MTRDDERRQLKGAGNARSPAEARRDEAPHVTGGVSHEADHPIDKHEGMDSSMARSRSGAKAGAETHAREEKAIEGDWGNDEVRGGRGITREHVEADHVIGKGGSIAAASAEGEPDMASSKANRKEAGEPEREANEMAAIGKEPSVAHKNTMGHGERETCAYHTI